METGQAAAQLFGPVGEGNNAVALNLSFRRFNARLPRIILKSGQLYEIMRLSLHGVPTRLMAPGAMPAMLHGGCKHERTAGSAT